MRCITGDVQAAYRRIFADIIAILKEISATEYCEIAWWQKKLMSHTVFVKTEFFKNNFSETVRYIGLKFSEITEIVMLFRCSEVYFIGFIR